jgi:glucose-1-phosphate thymidylyltransferase
MNIVVPMAGRGKRMRPHTLTVPKPLLPVAGKPIVQRLVEDLARLYNGKVEKVGFVIGDFGPEVEQQLLKIAEAIGAEGHIFHQTEPLGTAHAVLCAKEILQDNVIVAFADTLFKANFEVEKEKDGIIWVQKVNDPSSFGVVKVNEEQVITDFVEKPNSFVSDMAIIGIYYFRDGKFLADELQKLIDDDIRENGEYQLTNVLDTMKEKGYRFYPGAVDEWLDCGNKDVTVQTNARYLEFIESGNLIDPSANIKNSIVLEPCYVGPDVQIVNSVVGPHVSVGSGTTINNSRITKAIIQSGSKIENAVLENSMLGNSVQYLGKAKDVSLGDYTILKE